MLGGENLKEICIMNVKSKYLPFFIILVLQVSEYSPDSVIFPFMCIVMFFFRGELLEFCGCV